MTSKEEDHDFIDVKLVEELEKDGMIPLDIYTASMIGDFVTVGQLIQSGSIDFDKKNKNGGWTALMYASYVGRDNIVNMLLEAGASVNIATPKMGITALMLAADCGNESIAYFLVQVFNPATIQHPALLVAFVAFLTTNTKQYLALTHCFLNFRLMEKLARLEKTLCVAHIRIMPFYSKTSVVKFTVKNNGNIT